jgi:hypothetical protein
MRMLALLCLLALAMLAATALPARADDKLKNSSGTWKSMDNCNAAAIRAFPDYTPDSLAKREAARRRCLRQSNLPLGDDPRLPPK